MTRWRPLRWLRALALLAAVVGALGLIALGLSLYRDRVPASPSLASARIRVTIEPGSSLAAVARRLEAVGALSHAWQLRLVARLEGGDRTIKAGTYELTRGLSPASLLRVLVAGEVATVEVTLVEGWTAARVTSVLADSLDLDRERLWQAVEHPSAELAQRLELPEGQGLEGYLFPETYRFARGVPLDSVLTRLVATFEAAWDDSMRRRRAELGWPRHQVVTLASIVEAEARRPDERTRVAAVYHNRLARGWRLEADPTVAYALDKSGDLLSRRDLRVDSPYNTYRHRGLPPGPIGNPGRAALRAALWPEPGFDALFFVADGEGGHRFSRTWAEHRRAVRAYRRGRSRLREGALGGGGVDAGGRRP